MQGTDFGRLSQPKGFRALPTVSPQGRGIRDHHLPGPYWVARELDGRLRLGGDVSFGLAPDQRERLRHDVGRREIGAARRQGLRPVDLGVRLRVEAHGRPDDLLRHPVIRAVELPSRTGGTGLSRPAARPRPRS
jgi:hypothetical protein